ncbi:hypothetical protein BC629DRAFT_1547679 [Irpex lacteus]|nr:hypothetical protein BC629DRAFT_1547679 [Irpex lacteus]
MIRYQTQAYQYDDFSSVHAGLLQLCCAKYQSKRYISNLINLWLTFSRRQHSKRSALPH